MTNKFKKILIGIVASAMCVTGSMGAISASASTYEEFTVSHVNYYGAPSSESTTATRTIGHRSAGATATVSSCHNTDGSGATGKTYFDCVTYPDMSRKTISNLGTATLNPSIGNPSTDVDITYFISAYTSKSSNTYWSSGSIAKKS